MRTLVLVWVWFAFSILGYTFLSKTETFAVTRDFESNFLITCSPEDRFPNQPLNMVGDEAMPKFLSLHQATCTDNDHINQQPISFAAEIYVKTPTINKEKARIKLQSNSRVNGSIYNPRFLNQKYGSNGATIFNFLKFQKKLEVNKKVKKSVIGSSKAPSLALPFSLYNVQIINQDRITLSFSEALNPKTAIFPSNFVISGKHPNEVLLLDSPFHIQLSLSEGLVLGDSIEIIIKNLEAEDGQAIHNLTLRKLYLDGIEEIIIDTPDIIQILHEEPISNFDNQPEPYLIVDESFKIKVESDPNQPKVLLIKLDQALEEGKVYQLHIPKRETGTDLLPGTTRNILYDRTPPHPVRMEKYMENKVNVHFDESLDDIMSIVCNHYSLNGEVPEEVILNKASNSVVLVFNSVVQEKEDLELVVKNVADQYGNVLKEGKLSSNLKKAYQPSFKDLVINEVMAAPRPGNVLPNAEYVELYNTSAHHIQLGGYRLHNSRSSTAIPQSTIAPGEYLILCPNSQRLNFEPYGKVVGLTSWPTLLNAGDQVKLFDDQGKILDSLKYDRSNYGSTQLAQGGYSLEIVNPYSQCSQPTNLRPSLNPARGTPGLRNSIYDNTPDRTPPKILQATAIENIQILVEFSKPMSQNVSQVNWNISPAIEISEIEYLPGDLSQIRLTLASPLDERITYTVKVENIRDCAGNIIHPYNNQASFGLPSPAEAGEIIINEILFNPHTGTPKFVEIHNNSQKWVNIKNWKLANLSAGEIANRRVIASRDLVMAPNTYLAINTNSELLTQMYPKAVKLLQLASLPSYPIREGTVILLDTEEELLERLDYHENYHHPLLRDPRGVSLERIDPRSLPNEPRNWTSAAASIGYATPGFKNSQVYQENNLQSGINILPEVFSPDGIGGQNFTTINYSMDSPGYVGSIKMYDINGKLIKDIIQNDIWGSNGFYVWNGTDMQGKKVRNGYYVCWVEIFNLAGNVFHIKKTVVVATKLN